MSDACDYRSRTSKGTIHMTNDNVVSAAAGVHHRHRESTDGHGQPQQEVAANRFCEEE